MNHYGRVLPNRKHIVLCNDVKMNIEDENVEIIDDVNRLEKYEKSNEENFVIGGASIYKLLLPKANKLYITEINEEFDGDVYFPLIDRNVWKEVEREKGIKNENNPYDYDYVTYIKNNLSEI